MAERVWILDVDGKRTRRDRASRRRGTRLAVPACRRSSRSSTRSRSSPSRRPRPPRRPLRTHPDPSIDARSLRPASVHRCPMESAMRSRSLPAHRARRRRRRRESPPPARASAYRAPVPEIPRRLPRRSPRLPIRRARRAPTPARTTSSDPVALGELDSDAAPDPARGLHARPHAAGRVRDMSPRTRSRSGCRSLRRPAGWATKGARTRCGAGPAANGQLASYQVNASGLRRSVPPGTGHGRRPSDPGRRRATWSHDHHRPAWPRARRRRPRPRSAAFQRRSLMLKLNAPTLRDCSNGTYVLWELPLGATNEVQPGMSERIWVVDVEEAGPSRRSRRHRRYGDPSADPAGPRLDPRPTPARG